VRRASSSGCRYPPPNPAGVPPSLQCSSLLLRFLTAASCIICPAEKSVVSLNRLAANESGLSQQAAKFTGDAPLCDACGHITVRNGTCYKCLNCGSSMGCS